MADEILTTTMARNALGQQYRDQIESGVRQICEADTPLTCALRLAWLAVVLETDESLAMARNEGGGLPTRLNIGRHGSHLTEEQLGRLREKIEQFKGELPQIIEDLNVLGQTELLGRSPGVLITALIETLK